MLPDVYKHVLGYDDGCVIIDNNEMLEIGDHSSFGI